MKKYILFLFLFACAQIFPQEFREDIIDKMIVENLPIDGPGGTLLILKGDERVYEKSFGFTDVEEEIKNNSKTVYQIGSISKQFTTAGIMLLQERGELSISDPLTKYLPDFPHPAEKVTVEHLMLHNSGIKSFTNVSEWNPNWESKRSLEEVIYLVKDLDYDFEPGEKFAYNNTGYAILALIIEKVSGQNYGDFLKENIFDPLGMRNTRHGASNDEIGKRAAGYSLDMENKGIKRSIITEFPQLAGAGSLVSTVDDIAIWINAIKERKLLKDETWDEFLSPKIQTNFGGDSHYGYGIAVDNFHGHKLLWHSGGMPGFLTVFYYYPDEDISIIWLGNSDFVNSHALARQVSYYYFDIDPEKRIAAQIPAESLKKYEGIYLSSIFKIKATAGEDRLKMKPIDLPFAEIDLIPLSDNEFYAEGQYGVYITFRDENELVYDEVGQKLTFYREGFEPKYDTLALSESELKKYEGIYSFAPGNEMNVFIEEGKLKATLPGQPKYTLTAVGENEFILEGLQGFKMIFEIDEAGRAFSVTSHQPNGEFRAKKISDNAKKPKKLEGINLSRESLKKFEGEYEFAPANVMKVYLIDNKLKAHIPNQPVYTLIPVGENEFQLEELEGFKMIFGLNENGEVTEVVSHQPNGKFKAAKKD